MDLETMLADAAPARRASLDGPDSPAAISLYQRITAPTTGRHGVRARHRRRMTLTAAGAGLLAGATAIAIVIGLSGPSRSGPADNGPHFTAATLLGKIAAVADKAPVTEVTDNQFMYVASELSDSVPGKPAPGHLDKRQAWTPVADLCSTALVIENGKKFTTTNKPNSDQVANGIKARCAGSVNDPTYRFLQTLPTDPRVLLSLIRKATAGTGQSSDQEAFTTIGDLLRESIAPPAVSAALFRAAALIPEVTVIRHAVDAIGRPGVAVSYTFDGQRSDWIFDKHTLRLLGERDYYHGTLYSISAITARAFVDHAGDVPPTS